MNKLPLEKTLVKFLKAWKDKDIDAVVNLLSDKFKYYETPLEKPLTTKKAIIKLWQPVPETEGEIKLNYQTICLKKEYGLFRITGSFILTDVNKKYIIDRIFLISVDKQGLLTKFIQWRETKKLNL